MNFDNIEVTCLSLRNRTDRRYVMSKLFPSELFSRVNFHFGNTESKPKDWFCGNDSSWSIYISVQEIVEEFLSGDKDYLLLFKDDVILSSSCFMSELEHSFEALPKNWDCLFLGGYHIQEPKPFNSVINKCVDTINHEAILWNKKGLKKYLVGLREKKFAYSDRFLSYQMIKGEVNCYCTKSIIATQSFFETDNCDTKEFDFENIRLTNCGLSNNDQMCLYAFINDINSLYIDPSVSTKIFDFVRPFVTIESRPVKYNILTPKTCVENAVNFCIGKHIHRYSELILSTRHLPDCNIEICKT